MHSPALDTISLQRTFSMSATKRRRSTHEGRRPIVAHNQVLLLVRLPDGHVLSILVVHVVSSSVVGFDVKNTANTFVCLFGLRDVRR